MPDLNSKRLAANHEAGHLSLAYNFKPAGILSAGIKESGAGWDGDAKIRLTDVDEPSRAIVAVAGALAEARAQATNRFDNPAIELRVTNNLVSAVLGFVVGDVQAIQLDIPIAPAQCAEATVEASISRDDARWIAPAQRTQENLKVALEEACAFCNDELGWKVICAIANLLHDSPKRVYWFKLRYTIDAVLGNQE